MRRLSRTLTLLVAVLLVTWLLGLTSLRLLLLVAAMRLAVPLAFGWFGGKRIAADRTGSPE